MCTFISKSTKNYNSSSHCTLAKERKKIEKKMHTNKNIKQKNHCIIVVAYEWNFKQLSHKWVNFYNIC